MSQFFVEIPESSHPERWVRLQRSCKDRGECDALATRALKAGMFYRVVEQLHRGREAVAETVCTAYVRKKA